MPFQMVFGLDELGKGTIRRFQTRPPPPKTTELNLLSFKHDVFPQREVTVQGEKINTCILGVVFPGLF